MTTMTFSLFKEEKSVCFCYSFWCVNLDREGVCTVGNLRRSFLIHRHLLDHHSKDQSVLLYIGKLVYIEFFTLALIQFNFQSMYYFKSAFFFSHRASSRVSNRWQCFATPLALTEIAKCTRMFVRLSTT